ncbi:hypothetical protein VTL71DRAFT_15360 [Oculimacula yallundae]|uniref:Uncharacterized protein n=1 Tax=Oculimacula yallundae TaxID=86028 RepID=A0ABR4CGB9_9HELO
MALLAHLQTFSRMADARMEAQRRGRHAGLKVSDDDDRKSASLRSPFATKWRRLMKGVNPKALDLPLIKESTTDFGDDARQQVMMFPPNKQQLCESSRQNTSGTNGVDRCL